MKRYPIPAQEHRCEMKVANSHFIASLAPVFSVEEAKAFISRIHSEFGDASHNVPIFLVGHGDSVIAHCSDDGEPSGTAGRPALAVLKGSNLGDVAVVVTRYFGGTKLGTGGLVRAYGDAVREVVEKVPRAERFPVYIVMLGLPYSFFEQVRLLIRNYNGTILDETFTHEVTITAQFILDRFPDFESALREMSSDIIHAEIIETKDAIIPIVEQSSAK